MVELNDRSIDLIITSPPYWQLKDYKSEKQIGYDQSLHEYLKDLYRVWSECYRVIKPGRRLCINIGDQFARAIIYGEYKIIPLHSECISQCENIGFNFMGSIIWQKKTTMNTTGGATIMGSFPYPPNGMVEIDYEHILIFKKPGTSPKPSIDIKQRSEITKDEWKTYFSGHWYFGGARQIDHQAMFPEELPKRLIKMFSFYGDTVLDPFLGSGTTAKVALELERNTVGYEINESFLDIIKDKLGIAEDRLLKTHDFEIIHRDTTPAKESTVSYVPNIKDTNHKIDPGLLKFNKEKTYKVVSVEDADTLVMDTGLKVKLLGILISKDKLNDVLRYLNNFVLRKEVFLKYDTHYNVESSNTVQAYVYLKNKIFINLYLIKSGMASVDVSKNFDMKNKFISQIKSIRIANG
ncbi:MAG: site-specific DNA-methyltransferase [Deltaproteobacteria bacterium]|nr:site-specific DNA-methyltransferase [Deltaproteobacteria bacterium]MCL5278037.1 site-specific DNA-methyltransferase [Deltaproteobacteria bacterium]